MDKKRVILILVFTLACVGIGFLLYRVFFAGSIQAPETIRPEPLGSSTSTRGSLPTAGERTQTGQGTGQTTLPSTGGTRDTGIGDDTTQGGVQQVVETSILSPKIESNGSVAFYNKQDGRFYRINANGELELLSDEVFFNVEKVTWSPKETTSIIEYPDGANIYYNFATKKQVTLPKQWEEFSFESEGKSIAAKNLPLSPENNSIVTANPEGNNIRIIAPMGENASRVNVNWSPNKQIVATSRTGEALGADRQEILFVGLNGENYRSLVVEGRGFEEKWSPQGEKLLYSVYSARSEYKPELWIVDANPDTIGNERRLLNVNTWPDKCSFSEERFIYCGVPVVLQTGAGIAPAVADSSEDAIYRIDTETGAKTEIALPTTDHVVASMFVGDDGKTLFFTDKRKPGLFKIPL